MAEKFLPENIDRGNVEAGKAYLREHFNLSGISVFAEALQHVEQEAGTLSPEYVMALGELYDRTREEVEIVLAIREDPKNCEAVKALVDHLDELDQEEAGAGQEFLKFMIEFEKATKEAKAELQAEGVDHA